MRITIAAIGRAKPGAYQTLFTTYAERLPWKVTLAEFPASSPDKEAALLCKAAEGADKIILLDETGRSLTSPEFAKLIAKWGNEGTHHMAFLIGGADGHGRDARAKASLSLSLGAMTWPHMLVRGLLAEQLYRAWSINNNHPYHRE